jgi:hypothetical protein
MLCLAGTGIVHGAPRRRAVRLVPFPTLDCVAGRCAEIVPSGDAPVNSETVSLAPDDTSPAGGWYSARFHYFTNGAPKVTSFTLHVAAAPTPEQLDSAEEAVLGGAATNPHWQPDIDLTSLSRELHGCTWNDPGLLMRQGTLYLATQCMLFRGGEERPENEFIALFATKPSGRARTWNLEIRRQTRRTERGAGARRRDAGADRSRRNARRRDAGHCLTVLPQQSTGDTLRMSRIRDVVARSTSRRT